MEFKKEHSWGWLPTVIGYAFVVIFLSLAAYKIYLPGLQYDEALFVQPALGAGESIFIYRQWAGIPLMLMEYLGALKAWLYAPIFLIFGFSPVTMRLPMVLLSALTLVVFFRMLRREAGPWAACILIVLMAVDPAFIFHSRLDWGPFVIRMFIKTVVLDQWFLTVRSPSIARLFLIALLLALGIWDKLNFVWFAFAFTLGVATIYPATLFAAWKRSSRTWRILAAILAAVSLPLLISIASDQDKNDQPAPTIEELNNLLYNSVHAFSGNSLTTFLTNHPLRYPALNEMYKADEVLKNDPLLTGEGHLYLLAGAIVFLIIISPFICTGTTDRLSPIRKVWFVLILFWGTLAIMLITPGEAGGLHKSHHMMALYPYHLLALALFAGNVIKPRFNWSRRLLVALVLCCSLAFAIASFASTVRILNYFSEDRPLDPRWSPRIYELAEHVNREGKNADAIISIDWGIHNQVHALCDDDVRSKMADLWLDLKFVNIYPEKYKEILESLRNSDRTLVLLYSHRQGVQMIAVRNFLNMLRDNGLETEFLHAVKSGDNVIYEIWEARNPGAERQSDL